MRSCPKTAFISKGALIKPKSDPALDWPEGILTPGSVGGNDENLDSSSLDLGGYISALPIVRMAGIYSGHLT